jgi:hypothetical protein
MEPPVSPTRRIAVLYHLRRTRHWLVLLLGGVALALLPWTAFLSATLPGRHVAHHWDIAWAGFDLLEAGALIATLWALVRGSPLLPLLAAVAGTALGTDAWFDMVTATPGRELAWAVAEAVAAEFPLAALCFWIALDSTEALVSAATTPASGAAPPPTSSPARPGRDRGRARTGGSEAPSAGRTSR